MADLVRAVAWRRLDEPGSEYCALARLATGWRFEGTVTVALDGRPLLAHYRVDCARDWRTRAVIVRAHEGAPPRALRLLADARGRWWHGDHELMALRGCRDVDLGVTPSTNTLPIRRLGLAVGEARELTAAWVRFPDLTVQPLEQRYTRLAERRYRYESLIDGGGAFRADLDLDDLGLVTRYAGLFERIATTGA